MKPTAVFTIVRNEGFWLPRWVKHYAHVGDLYVLDHESDDGSTHDALRKGFAKFDVSRPHTDDVGWMLDTVQGFQARLFGVYDRVVFAEVDEFLIPDPARYDTLANYLAWNTSDQITATGYDVVMRAGDPALNLSEPILSQRGWKRNDRWDKTLVASGPMKWEVGFHRPVEGTPRPEPTPDLLLVHFHYADLETQWARLESRRKGRQPFPNSWGAQNKLPDRAAFNGDFASATANPEEIPERFRRLM